MDDPEAALRALYRQVGEAGHAQVRAEHRRLFPDAAPEHLAQILRSAWKEGRELAGQRYDYGAQTWRGPNGEVVE